MPRINELWNIVLYCLLGWICDYEMKAVIDDGPLLCKFAVFFDHSGKIHADVLSGKRNNCRRSAKSCGSRCCFPRVGIHDPGRGQLLYMGMGVDAARQYELSSCIDFFAP